MPDSHLQTDNLAYFTRAEFAALPLHCEGAGRYRRNENAGKCEYRVFADGAGAFPLPPLWTLCERFRACGVMRLRTYRVVFVEN